MNLSTVLNLKNGVCSHDVKSVDLGDSEGDFQTLLTQFSGSEESGVLVSEGTEQETKLPVFLPSLSEAPLEGVSSIQQIEGGSTLNENSQIDLRSSLHLLNALPDSILITEESPNLGRSEIIQSQTKEDRASLLPQQLVSIKAKNANFVSVPAAESVSPEKTDLISMGTEKGVSLDLSRLSSNTNTFPDLTEVTATLKLSLQNEAALQQQLKQLLTQGNNRDIEMQLTPHELGKLRISVSTQGENTQAQLGLIPPKIDTKSMPLSRQWLSFIDVQRDANAEISLSTFASDETVSERINDHFETSPKSLEKTASLDPIRQSLKTVNDANPLASSPKLSPQNEMALQQQMKNALVQGENRQIEMRLDPPELGKLRISVSAQGESTSVQFVVTQPQAKEALESQLPRLREVLQQEGLSLGDVGVSEERDSSGRTSPFEWEEEERIIPSIFENEVEDGSVLSTHHGRNLDFYV